MKLKLLAMLLIVAALLAACGYVVVEDPNRQTIGSLLMPAAFAEGEGAILDAAHIADNNTKDEGRRALPRVTEHMEPLTDETPAPTPSPTAAPEPTPTPMARGSKGEDVKALQTLLKQHGFLNGKADGDFGAKTDGAVRAAQEYKRAIEEAARKQARETVLKSLKQANERAIRALAALTITPTDGESAAPASEKLPDVIPMASITANLAPPAQYAPFAVDGVVTDELLEYLTSEFRPYAGDLIKGSGGSDVRRLQTRLNDMYYLYGGIDGSFGGNTQKAVKYFQKLNGLEQTGVADEKTQKLLFSADCKLSDYPMYRYRVEISVSKQKVYVYEWNYGAYSKLKKSMKCTTGAVDTPTPLGSFAMGGPCGKWYYFSKFECWAQYASRITGGILFHSVLYSERDVKTLRQGSVNALGSRASHGCVRLAVDDAKWIYNNIPAGTICRIYN